jgi:hypothetical protein
MYTRPFVTIGAHVSPATLFGGSVGTDQSCTSGGARGPAIDPVCSGLIWKHRAYGFGREGVIIDDPESGDVPESECVEPGEEAPLQRLEKSEARRTLAILIGRTLRPAAAGECWVGDVSPRPAGSPVV